MPALTVPYLGKPGDMRRLPSPNGPVTVTPVEPQVSTLLSGGTVTQQQPFEKRTFGLPYEWLPAADADLLRAFRTRLLGLGPFVFVDPTPRNVLGLDVASCGARSFASLGWVTSSGAIGRTGGGPAGVNSGVLSWAGFSASATVQPGFSLSTAPAWLPLESMTVSLWIKTSVPATVTLSAVAYNTAGSVLSSAGSSRSATTGWTSISVTVAGSSVSGAAFVLPRVTMPSGSFPSSAQIAAAQVEYNTTATAWQPGNGAPRVLPVPASSLEVPKIEPNGLAYYNQTFTVAET